jgi:chemotaxis protein MotB
MSRRRRSRGHGNHERWLVSYADFITLLFAFFVVLYASAQVDQRKVGKLALAIQVAFQELGVFPDSTTQIPINTNEPMPFANVQAIANATHSTELGRVLPSPNGSLDAVSEQSDLSGLQDELQKSLQDEINLHTIAIHREREGLVISLREFGFFDSGSAALKPSAMAAFERIASILSARKCALRLEGHTDNIPIHTGQMASNWELSTARSTELVRLLIQKYNFAPQRLSAAGYAQYHPIADNTTPQGRAQNRRVDIVILSEQDQPRSPARAASRSETTNQRITEQTKPSPAIP